jgi:UPF0755 protein
MRSRARFLLLIILLALSCLAVSSGAGYLSGIRSRVTGQFGSGDPSLGELQRFQLALILDRRSADLLNPIGGSDQVVLIEIVQGSSAQEVARALLEQGLIVDTESFLSLMVYLGADTRLQSGRFRLSNSMNAVEILTAIQDPLAADLEFRMFAGWRLEEVAIALEANHMDFSAAEFQSAARSAHRLPNSGVSLVGTVEGFLFPGVYFLPRESSAQDVIAMMLIEFDLEVTTAVRQGFAEQGLNLAQAVTLASIIQREAVVADEMPMIASVFYNRLINQDRLQADPTVQYALASLGDVTSWWPAPLSLADLEIDSAFNTYIYPGLPPAPISSPSLLALDAVAHPAISNFYYFRAGCDGSGRHLFATTFDEHLANACP